MSLSLSSLLNPSPDADVQVQTDTTAPRKDSLPPISYVQSPEQTHAPSMPAARQGHSYPAATEQDAIQGLAALAGSPPAPGTSHWYGQGYERRSSSSERRPGSKGMQLPMPTSDGRKMSSPTLEHYHVPSRSPEQSRASVQGMTLPPLQQITSQEESARVNAYDQAGSLQQPAREGEAAFTSPSLDAGQGLARTISSELQSKPQSPPQPQKVPSPAEAEALGSSPAAVKQEATLTPPVTSPTEARRTSIQQEMDGQPNKAVATLKSEHSAITQSPLRESSVPIPSTEIATPEVVNPKKRPAPTRKKGTATTTNKKAPPAKKRKVETKRSATPTSVASKTAASKLSKGTPANSSPGPSTRSVSAEPNDELYDDDDDMEEGTPVSDDVYCLCRRPDTGTFMIGCDGTCDDWFHGKCVGIEERDKNLIDKYMCPNCEKAGIGQTTWKRICRREGCRMPAKIGKSKTGKDGSKYCSEECGVKYFREMLAKTRGREEAARDRASRRKGSIASYERPEDDAGARGGALAAGELKALVTSSKSAEDFKKLGEGVLSPPATPGSKKPSNKDDILTESEAASIKDIARQKDEAREKHQLLKDRMKFVTMVKQAASRTATEKELKPKDYCGYDSRLEWTDAQFDRWRKCDVGKQAFELETLAVESSDAKDGVVEDGDEFEVCERKKCARHLEWTKLAVDDVRAYMSDNGDRMRALDGEEKGIRGRAALRAKTGEAGLTGEGTVEVHSVGQQDLGIEAVEDAKVELPVPKAEDAAAEEMDVDRPIEQTAVVQSVEDADVAMTEAVINAAPATPAVEVA